MTALALEVLGWLVVTCFAAVTAVLLACCYAFGRVLARELSRPRKTVRVQVQPAEATLWN